ncbi:MAG: TIGR04348 family glycosyltransferase [Gammaproteobacteria bacterium]|nr:MAG: TIGR04348 family glycosyltransferase [Gammaproteobacteria bacterium]
MPKICLLTPAPPGSTNGNRATAERWSRLLGEAGYTVDITSRTPARDSDGLIALHATRSADAIAHWSTTTDKPLIVVLTGTDVYHYQHEQPEVFAHSLRVADALVGLHGLIHRDIPEDAHGKLHIIWQSASPLRLHQPVTVPWRVVVVGHLRDEKDPLRAARAVRNLPLDSRIEVVQLGKAHTAEWAKQAEAEMARNPNYRWLGECDAATTARWMASAQAMVISSVMEGGANVVSEACAMGLPVIASKIPGNTGLLGEDYPALFPPGNTEALRQLLRKGETHPSWMQELRDLCWQIGQEKFRPETEQAALVRLLTDLGLPPA